MEGVAARISRSANGCGRRDRPKPTSSDSMPSIFWKSPTIGIEPPMPIISGRLRPFVRQRVLRLVEQRRVVGKLDRRRAAMADGTRRSSRPGASSAHRRGRRRGSLSGSCLPTRRKETLAEAFGGDDRLEALAGIAAADAVDLGGRARPDQFQHASGPFRRRDPRGRSRRGRSSGRLAEPLPGRLDLGRGLLDAVIEAFERHAAGLVMQAGERLSTGCGSGWRRRRRT